MIRRFHRITFRLTEAEFQRFGPLVGKMFYWTWSDLVRVALKKVAEEYEKTTSDNGVGHPIGCQTAGPAVRRKATKVTAICAAPGRKTRKK